jgi:hypothetical protein
MKKNEKEEKIPTTHIYATRKRERGRGGGSRNRHLSTSVD